MAFHTRFARAYMSEALESMPDYATALRTYESRKPYIKGKHKGERPLGRNRKQDRSRIRIDEKGNIVVQHWQTDIIVYKPNGSISLHTGGWSSISTAQIMQELLGLERICRVHCKIYYRHDGEFHYLAQGLHIEPDGSPSYTNDEYVYKPQFEVMKKYRNQYAFFSEYAKQVLTLSSDFKVGTTGNSYNNPVFVGETLKDWYMAPLLKASHRYDMKARDRARGALFDYLDFLSTKEENDRLQPMYELLAPVTYMMGNNYHCSFGSLQWECNYAQFKRGFNTLLKHQFGSEIFRLMLASKKTPVRDPNAKYMR